VGRSNVGKSTPDQRADAPPLARTSAAPGKTRLANVYRVQRGSSPPLYLVDLPGYGYARGGVVRRSEFADLTRAYFGQRGARSSARCCSSMRGIRAWRATWRHGTG
jgi:GTP-binding protein